MLDLISRDNGRLTIDFQNLNSVSGETVFRHSSERPNELQSEAEVAASSDRLTCGTWNHCSPSNWLDCTPKMRNELKGPIALR